MSRDNSRKLRNHLIVVSLAALLLLLLLLGAVRPGGGRAAAGLGIAVLLLHLALLWRWRTHNRAADTEPLAPNLGVANLLTVSRAVLNSLLIGLVVAPAPASWLPALLYTSATLIDLLDGYVARVTQTMTRLGARLDVEYDALGMLIAIGAGLRLGKLPLWYLAVGVARYLYLLLLLRAPQQQPLTASWRRRLWAGLNMAFVGVALWPNVAAEFSRLAALFFGIPLLAGFVRDYLVASSRLEPQTERYLAARFWLLVILERWLPLYARLAIVYLLTSGHLPAGPLLLLPLPAILGVAPRVSAILLVVLAVFGVMAPVSAQLLLGAALILLLFDGGPYSLWRPEAALFEERLG